MMNTWGANVIPSPSNLTEAGRKILKEFPDSAGSLGIAISEAVGTGRTGSPDELFTGKRAKPRAASSNHHRRGSTPSNEESWGRTGYRDRLFWRRFQP